MSFIGKYEVIRELASGGMAKVFLARAAGPKGFEKRLVIKQILPHLTEDPQFVEMFLSEARTAAEFNHPNVVQIFELGESDGSYYIAMELIDGPNLRTLNRRAHELRQPLRPPVIAQLVVHACEGLAYAHEFRTQDGQAMELVHRDVSPENILLSRSGTVKVVDFGIAKGANDGNPHHTRTGSVKGKLAYMAPEQISGSDLDRRADVYALGVVLYELLSGVKPYRNATSDVKLMHSILYEEIIPLPERRPDLDPTLVAIVQRALAKDRAKRYQNCRELQSDLAEYISLSGEMVTPAVLAKLVQDLAPTDLNTVARTPPRSTTGPVLTGPGVTGSNPGRRVTGSNPGMAARPPPLPAQELSVDVVLEGTGESRRPAPSSQKSRRMIAIAAAVGMLVVLAAGAGVIVHKSPAPAAAPAAAPVATTAPAQPPAAAAAASDSATTNVAAAPAHVEALEETTADADGAARSSSASRAVFSVDSAVHGLVRVNGRAVGTAPLRGIQAAPGNVRVELIDRDSGFRKTETFRLHAGDNGTKVIPVDEGEVEFRVRPYATVMLDGRTIGQTPLTVSAREGRHEITLINKDLGKQIQLSYVVKPNQLNVVKYILGE